ncbi:MAG: hypothetical protein H6668_25580, partial [Ardenticatenaceae bacterium]|nr:hypothetical protein [Ardenticatenaceae bacterium]
MTKKYWLLRLLWLIFAVIVLLGTGIVGGVLLERNVLAATPLPNTTADFQLIDEAWQTVLRHYVDRTAVTDERLTYGAISGLIDGLGDTGHSRFLSPDMVQEQHDYTAGEFEGIGAYVESQNGYTVIVA